MISCDSAEIQTVSGDDSAMIQKEIFHEVGYMGMEFEKFKQIIFRLTDPYWRNRVG